MTHEQAIGLVLMLATIWLAAAGMVTLRMLTGRYNATRAAVYANLDSARECGHFGVGGALYGWPPNDIAVSMAHDAEGCEHLTPHQIVPYVREWLWSTQP